MQVRYQDIRINREYIITGRGPYYYHPRMVIKVLQQPPPFSAEGNFYPGFQVRVLRVIDLPVPNPNPANQVSYTPGQVFVLNWRSNFWGQAWNDWGPCWEFRNAVLEPLPSDLQTKALVLSELKAVPSNPPQHPGFPGGSDFLALAAQQHQAPSAVLRTPRIDLEGGKTFYGPLY